jgi:hypothetical protein
MSTIHLVMQGKGGVGKSLLAFYVAQYVKDQKQKCLVFDTDPLNPTLSRTASFEAKVVKLLADDRTTIIKSAFDEMIEACENMDSDAVIDVGASSFVPMLEYCGKNGVFDLWDSMGHKCLVHSIITGKDFTDTCDWFGEIMRRTRHLPSVSAVVWLNPCTGPVEKDGRIFEDTVQYKENRDRIRTILPMPLPASVGSFGMRSFNEMMAAGETLEEYHRGPHFIMERQTMIMFKRKLFEMMDRAGIAL